jgi:uncharacterized membrane protein
MTNEQLSPEETHSQQLHAGFKEFGGVTLIALFVIGFTFLCSIPEFRMMIYYVAGIIAFICGLFTLVIFFSGILPEVVDKGMVRISGKLHQRYGENRY